MRHDQHCADLELDAQPTAPFMIFGCAKGLAAIAGPFVAAALHPKSAADDHSAGSGGWSGYSFTGMFSELLLRDQLIETCSDDHFRREWHGRVRGLVGHSPGFPQEKYEV